VGRRKRKRFSDIEYSQFQSLVDDIMGIAAEPLVDSQPGALTY